MPRIGTGKRASAEGWACPAIIAVVRVAALYDIHGNLPALRAVLADVEREQADVIVFGGDGAAGPLPAETLECLMAFGQRARFVLGNADREIVDAYDAGRRDPVTESDPPGRAAAFAAARISREQRDFLASFAPVVALDVDGLGPVLFCHGSPRSDTEIITPLTPEERLQEILAAVDQKLVVCGHTHRQFDRRCEGWRVVNAGSVGVPYEGRAGAYWALLGPEVELRRTDYGLAQAVTELRAASFPDVEEMISESLLQPADPDSVSELFERQATLPD